MAFTYDLDDRLTGVAHQPEPSLDQVHDYDAEDRLIETDRSTWTAPWLYTWDAVGNRETRLQGGNGWQNAYGLADNRLSSVAPVVGGVAGSPVSRIFDAMGNTINDGAGKTYGYDAAGRLVSFNGGGAGASFVVGSNGLRSRKTVTGIGAGDRLYAYDDQRRLVGVYMPDASGGFTVSEELVYLPDSWRTLGTVRGQVAGGASGTFYPVLSDQIETPRVVLDPASGDRRWTWQGKEAFGDTAPNENPDAVGVFRFDARFPGQWFDPETGLFHNGFRDYDPGTGRYVQSDPIGLRGGWNTYSYVGGAPSYRADPFGLFLVVLGGSEMANLVNKELDWISRRSPTARGLVERIRSDDRIFFVDPKAKKTYVDPRSPRILRWNQNAGVVIEDDATNTCYQQPGSVGLVHEFGHMLGDQDVGRGLLKIQDRAYGNKEERRVMTQYEDQIMRELGLPPRKHHFAKKNDGAKHLHCGVG